MRAYHDRHVPLTPRLLEAILEFETARVPSAVAPWGSAFDMAGQAIGASGVFGRSTIWRHAVESFHSVVVEPVVRSASRSAGVTCLVSDHDEMQQRKRGVVDALRDGCVAIERESFARLLQYDLMGKVFWMEVAVSLLDAADKGVTGSHRILGQSSIGKRTRLPIRPDRTMVRLMFEFEPEFEASETDLALERVVSRPSEKERSGLRPKQGGVRGVAVSKRFEDVQDALLSEFAWPPNLLAQRVLEEGILIRHRPPYRRPTRDILFVTVSDLDDSQSLLSILRAAWGEAALRSSMSLVALGFPKSDLAWGEVRYGGARGAAVAVDAMPTNGTDDPLRLAGRNRSIRWMQSGVAASLADLNPAVLAVAADKKSREGHAYREAIDALNRPVLRIGVASVPSDDTHGFEKHVDLYRRVVVTLLTSACADDEEARIDVGEMRRQVIERFGLRNVVEVSTHSVLVPSDHELDVPIRLVSESRDLHEASVAIDRDADKTTALRRTFGRLTRLFMSIVLDGARA